MKTILRSLLVLTTILTTAAFAGETIAFKVGKKRAGMERTKTESTMKTEEHLSYHVMMENQSFKDLPKLEVRYFFFTSSEVPGSDKGKAKETKQSGSQKIDNFKNTAKFEFDTSVVDLKKSELIGGWYYDNGAKTRANATLNGIWIRVYQNENIVAEFSEPADLKTKKKWD